MISRLLTFEVLPTLACSLRLTRSIFNGCDAFICGYNSLPQDVRPQHLPPRVCRTRSARLSINSQPSTLNAQRCRAAFTLFELLIVVGIIGLLMVLIAPAFTTIKGGTDVTSAAYTIKGVLDTARTYAKANNTYTWVGFFEEDASLSSTIQPPLGPGRIVISIVASKDGSNVYGSVVSPAADMDSNGTKLLQVGKLIKLENMHLRTFANGSGYPRHFSNQDRQLRVASRMMPRSEIRVHLTR